MFCRNISALDFKIVSKMHHYGIIIENKLYQSIYQIRRLALET
jgi:hypothetical protein